MTVSLRLDGVRVAYAHARSLHTAVDGFTMSLDAGRIGCLLGPSGCGKTTVLRAIAGFEPVRAGTIHLDQHLLSAPQQHLPPEQRRVGMMFQEFALFPHLSAAQNIGFGLRRLGEPQRQARVTAMLRMVGLDDAAARYPHELSGGQQQRIALARALAPAPALLLLDEPFSNLDIDARERLAAEVGAILRAAGQTAILVTHNEAEARAMGDAIGWMSGGVLVRWQKVERQASAPVAGA